MLKDNKAQSNYKNIFLKNFSFICYFGTNFIYCCDTRWSYGIYQFVECDIITHNNFQNKKKRKFDIFKGHRHFINTVSYLRISKEHFFNSIYYQFVKCVFYHIIISYLRVYFFFIVVRSICDMTNIQGKGADAYYVCRRNC